MPGHGQPLTVEQLTGERYDVYSRQMATIRLERDLPAVAAEVRRRVVDGPVRQALREAMKDSEVRRRYLSLRAQTSAAEQRARIAAAQVERLKADRNLAEARAEANLGKRLVEFDQRISAAEQERQAALAEVAALKAPKGRAFDQSYAEARAAFKPVWAQARAEVEAAARRLEAETVAAIAGAVGPLLDAYLERRALVSELPGADQAFGDFSGVAFEERESDDLFESAE